MEINKLLLESYLVFGIILTYTLAFIIGVLVGNKEIEKELNNGEQVQSKEKISVYGTKFKIME